MFGITTLETWLFKNAAAKGLTALLNKLPANGGKMFLGALLVVLGEVARDFPGASFSPFVSILIQIVEAAGPAAVLNTGIVTTIVGTLHKVLKFFNPTIVEPPVVPVIVPVS